MDAVKDKLMQPKTYAVAALAGVKTAYVLPMLGVYRVENAQKMRLAVGAGACAVVAQMLVGMVMPDA